MIPKEFYEFCVNDLHVPCEGKIKGLGEAYNHLVTAKDTVPCDCSQNINGDFYQPSYVSVVVPGRVIPNEELIQKIREAIINMRSDGTYEVWDTHRQRTIELGNTINSRYRNQWD